MKSDCKQKLVGVKRKIQSFIHLFILCYPNELFDFEMYFKDAVSNIKLQHLLLLFFG